MEIKSGRNLLRFLLVPAIIALLGLIGWEMKEWVKQEEGFCVSCHISEKEPLHKVKYSLMIAIPPVTLAGVHYGLAGERLSCPDCHRGFGIAGRSYEAFLEVKNSFIYFFGSFKEPKNTSLHITNTLCEPCHKDLQRKGIKPRFHSFQSHDGIKDPSCIKCHPQHAPKPEGGEFLNKPDVLNVCERCHRNAKQSAFVIQSLKM